MEPDFQSFLYLLYLLNSIVGLLLGLFLYREYHEGFMVLIRDRVFSLRWVVVPLLLLVPSLNLFWLYKIRALSDELVVLLLMFSGLVAPFLWMALTILFRFLLIDVLMGFLGGVSDSFSGFRTALKQQFQQHELKELHQHEDMMEKIRRVRRQWAKRVISRKDAVDEISKIKKKEKQDVKRSTPKAGKRRKPREAKSDSGISSVMSNFAERFIDEKEKKQ